MISHFGGYVHNSVNSLRKMAEGLTGFCKGVSTVTFSHANVLCHRAHPVSHLFDW